MELLMAMAAPSDTLTFWPAYFFFCIYIVMCTQVYKTGPSGLVPTGEAAHPAVALVGTWCESGEANVQLYLFHIRLL